MVTSVPFKAGKYSGTSNAGLNRLFNKVASFLRRCLFRVLSVGPIPTHLAFIMDGNRRYAKKQNLEEGDGHKAGYLALMSLLHHCYELGIKYVTVYAFSIENFKRRPDEVQGLMDLMIEKMEALLMEESIVNQYGIRVYFIGNLNLLSEAVRDAAEKVMRITSKNSKAVLLVCVAYTASDEIVHAVEGACKEKGSGIRLCNLNNGVIDDVKEGEKMNGMIVHDVQKFYDDRSVEPEGLKHDRSCNGAVRVFQKEIDLTTENLREEHPVIKLVDVEKHMYMAVAPDPGILIRSSGETRLSNFLLWQSSHCQLFSPVVLWPELGLTQLVWVILKFQQTYSYLEKKKKQL